MPDQPSPDDLNAYWSKPIDAVLAALHSSPQGLTSAEAATRLAQRAPTL